MSQEPSPELTKWIVFAGLSIAVVEASSPETAKEVVLAKMGLDHKPWLAKEWRARLASEYDLRRYAALADNVRGPQPTEKTARERAGKRRRKTVAERLFPVEQPENKPEKGTS